MRLKRAFLFVHKWLALIVGIQVGIWLLSGFVMALLPIETVRGEHRIAAQPPASLEALLPVAVTTGQAITLAGGRAVAVTLTSLLGEPVYAVRRDDGSLVLVDARGAFVLSPIQADLARRIADADFAGDGQPIATELVTTAGGDYRGRLPAWRVTFDDAESTRIYVADDDGRVTARRSDTWRLYDFFWMLHIMDYGAREDFNTPWMIVLSFAGVLVAFSGLPLLWYAVLKPYFFRRPPKAGRAP